MRNSDLPLRTSTTLALNRLKSIRNVIPSEPTAAWENVPAPRRAAKSRRGLLALALAASVAVAGGAAAMSLQKPEAHAAVSETPALRHVSVVKPRKVSAGEITLPATLRPYQATDIFARTSGYLKAWHVDIGDSVEAGELLAELDTPELDQELLQAEALQKQAEAGVAEAVAEHAEAQQQVTLIQANIERTTAQLQLAKITHQRNQSLGHKGAVSEQEIDESKATLESREAELAAVKADLARQTASVATREATIQTRQATLAAAGANVKRLRELQGFQRLTAPFAGVVTRRNAEVGMLVTAGSVNQQSLFSLAEQDKLRVQVAVPQSQSSQIAVGDEASILVPERPDERFVGTITRTAASVDPRSRTLNVEIELPNDQQTLLPGAYGEVHLATQNTHKKTRIPASALLLKSSGTFVAKVDHDATVQLLAVRLGRDFGNEVEVVQGLQGDESLVVNPVDDLTSGEQVTLTSVGAE